MPVPSGGGDSPHAPSRLRAFADDLALAYKLLAAVPGLRVAVSDWLERFAEALARQDGSADADGVAARGEAAVGVSRSAWVRAYGLAVMCRTRRETVRNILEECCGRALRRNARFHQREHGNFLPEAGLSVACSMRITDCALTQASLLVDFHGRGREWWQADGNVTLCGEESREHR